MAALVETPTMVDKVVRETVGSGCLSVGPAGGKFYTSFVPRVSLEGRVG